MLNVCIFFFKQKTAYEMRISDWSSDVCSSDLQRLGPAQSLVVVGRDQRVAAGAQYGDDRRAGRDLLDLVALGQGDPESLARGLAADLRQDRKSVVQGTSVSVRVDLGGRRIIKQKKYHLVQYLYT